MASRPAPIPASPDDPGGWGRFEALPAAERLAAVEALKGVVDQLVRSDPPAALAEAELLVRASESVPERRALALRGRAAAAHINGRGEEALQDYVAAAALHEEAGEDVEAARVRRSLVDVHQMAGRSAEALACARAARAVFERAGEERLLAQLELNEGNVHFRLDDLPRSRELYAAARARFRSLEDDLGLAFAEYSLANLETEAARFEEAGTAWRSARAVWERVGMAVHVADCDYSLAYLESRRGRFGDALRGLAAAREQYAGVKPAGVPLCDLDLAELYLRLDAWRDALEHARRAAAGFEGLGLDYERAKADVLVGLARFRLGDEGRGLGDLGRAAATFRRLGNRTLQAALEIQTGALRTAPGAAAGDPVLLDSLRAACARLEAAGNRFLAALGTVTLARALTSAGDAREALGRLDALIEDRGSAGGPRDSLDALVHAEALRAAAEAHRRLGEPQSAAGALRASVAVIEESYAQVPGTDVRIAFFRERHAAFVDLARLLIELGEPGAAEEALALLERSRMRHLGERPGWRPDAAPGFRAARERLDWLLGRRLDAELGALAGPDGEAPRAPSPAELLAAERELVERAQRLARDPGAASPRFGEGERRECLGANELLLAYLAGPRNLAVLAADRGGVTAHGLELERGELADLLDRLHLQLSKFRLGSGYLDAHRERLQRSTERLLAELGRRLLEPVADRIGGRDLIVVPHGPLHGLPFHALGFGGRPLIASRTVSYTPSASLLWSLRREPAAPAGRLLATGAVEESAPGIARELEELEELFAGRLERLEPGDLRDALAALEGRGGLLHLAAHGSFQPGHPVFSGMRLGSSFLTAYDLRQMRLPLDLVVLSGCETGRGARVGGEELFGLGQALFTAGARGVIGSLWTVGDDDTRALMGELYGGLARGLPAGRALAEAQRALMESRPHPFSWSPYVLSGDPDARLAAGSGDS